MSSPEQVKNIFGMLYNVVVVITCFNLFSDLIFFYIGIKSLMLKFREDYCSPVFNFAFFYNREKLTRK